MAVWCVYWQCHVDGGNSYDDCLCQVLLRDASAVLGALCSAQRIYLNERCWPHRELFPLGLVLTKKVAVLNPQEMGFRALLVMMMTRMINMDGF